MGLLSCRALVLWVGSLLVYVGTCSAQGGRVDPGWATTGADAQRSSWVRSDPKISKQGVGKPEFRFLWKLKLGDNPGLNHFTPAVLLTHYIGYRGFRDLALVESNNDKVYGIDVDLGRIEWSAPLKAQESGSCGSELTAGLARPTVTTVPFFARGVAGPGRGGPARSAVGEPDQGGVTLLRPPPIVRPIPVPSPALPGAPVVPGGSNAPAIPGSGGALPAPKLPPVTMRVIAADGMVHTMFVSNGLEAEAPVEFLPPGAAARGFIVLNNMAYAAVNGCSGGSGLRALDLISKQIAKWDGSGEMPGADGPAFAPDGTVFVTTAAGEIVALDGRTLAAKGKYSGSQPFVTSPTVFQFRQRVLAIAGAKDGSIHLVDTRALGGADGKTPVAKTPALPGKARLVPGALATFQDVGGRRWILAPVTGSIGSESKFTGDNGTVKRGAIAAWQVSETDGNLSLVPGWISRDLPAPSVPMIMNGIVFAVVNGDPGLSSKKPRHSSAAVIYALDGLTGKELWNSGKAITASAHHGRLSGDNSQIYLGTDDGTFYAFGSWIERQ